jgi:hypothetical protein
MKLRMVPVAARFAAQHGSGEQALAPERDKTLWI